uniref:Histone-lysine N-methyltransferase SETMAR n=1 Tax=Cacopsylla melanoneura TaxID=428564 RepID=A0A8D9AAQ2_9HEMI
MAARRNEDKVEIIFLYGRALKNAQETTRLYNELYPERPVCVSYVTRLVKKFKTTFSVKDAPRSGRPSVDENVELDILLDIQETPRQSIRDLSKEHDVSYNKVQKLLKVNKFHPYKVQLIHALNEDDPDRRVQFCDQMLGMIQENNNIVEQICFSDESTFFLNGSLHRHNCRYWSTENNHVTRVNHTQYPVKINVWAGILGDHIVGPFFIEENLTGNLYLELLEQTIIPNIIEIVGNNAEEFDPIFQQDGAPPHFARQVRDFLNIQFRMWIGRRGHIEWPPRSPDLTPLDFFLWGYLKSKVYETPPNDIQDLKNRITNACRTITPGMLRNVRQEFVNRLHICREQAGSQFEQLL